MIGLESLLSMIRLEGWIAIGIIVFFGVLLLLSHRAETIGPSNLKSLISLKLAMLVTAIIVFGASILTLQYTSTLFEFSLEGFIYLISIFVVFFMFFQWLFSPKFINSLYKVDIIEAPSDRDEAWLLNKITEISRLSGLKRVPKVGIARGLRIPNAFAYSSPIYGMHVAVTPSLIQSMPKDELEAVLAHEIGHLKHRDVAAMLAISFIPILIYYLGRQLMFLSVFGYGGRDRDRGSGAYILVIALILIIAGILFQFLVKHFNRLREYYADAHSAVTLRDTRAMQRALARLDLMYKDIKSAAPNLAPSNNAISMLFIYSAFIDFYYDPIDAHIEELKSSKTSWIMELLSTHPPIPKRIRFLDKLTL